MTVLRSLPWLLSCVLCACAARDRDEAAHEGVRPVVTTLGETLQPEFGWGSYVDDGRPTAPSIEFGALHPRDGEPHVLRHQLALPDGSGADSLVAGALPDTSRSALYAFLIADAQLVDQDSPAQIAGNAHSPLKLSSFRPAGELAPHLFDALVRTANAFQDVRPFDVVCLLGDSVENAQQNELDWFLTILEGGVLSADSGERNDMVPGPDNDAFDPFVAEGLREGTPWINVVGNHDVNVNGSFPPGLIQAIAHDDGARLQFDEVLAEYGFTLAGDPTSAWHPSIYPHDERPTFVVVREKFAPEMLPYEADSLAHLQPGAVMADPARATLDARTYAAAHWDAGGVPEGHGFPAEAVADGTGWYAHDPVPGVPVRIVALALGASEGGTSGILARPSRDGELDPEREGDPRHDQVAFLEAELARAARDDVALFVISHHASDSVTTQPGLQGLPERVQDKSELSALWSEHIGRPVDAVGGEQLRRMLASSPQVIAHIAGHHHVHQVRAICPDGSKRSEGSASCEPGADGQTGYWEILTSAVVAFPHQGRFLELVHVEGQLAALYLTVLDPSLRDGGLLELGRFIARAWLAVGDGGSGGAGQISDRNLLLPVWLPEGVASRLDRSELPLRIESETTLRESLPALPSLPVWPASGDRPSAEPDL